MYCCDNPGRGDGTTSGENAQSCPHRNALKKGMVLKTYTNARENTCAIPLHHARSLPESAHFAVGVMNVYSRGRGPCGAPNAP